MKKKTLFSYLALLALLVLPMSVQAQDATMVKCMVLTQKDGTVTRFALRDAPVMTYEGSQLVVSCGEQQMSTEMTGITDIHFEDTEGDGIAPIREQAPKASFSFGQATFSGLKTHSAIGVYTIDGKMVMSTHADAEGHAQIDLTPLSRGIYIVRTPSQSYKIKK